ncbi:hypothetical protein Ciccas_004589 [Cichlidogyrus casuarinus]|uniref:Uncharacterized protein n=1 Tax=Cichlidogyrus casuarinus TaxID=1844966 RepID=A0ABD2QBK8_9PLAT
MVNLSHGPAMLPPAVIPLSFLGVHMTGVLNPLIVLVCCSCWRQKLELISVRGAQSLGQIISRKFGQAKNFLLLRFKRDCSNEQLIPTSGKGDD